MSGGEVETWIWRPAVAATKRYFRGIMARSTIGEQCSYRTGYIMGYRAGFRLAQRLRDKASRQQLGKTSEYGK